jgi:polysaccharide export outer membrane protein
VKTTEWTRSFRMATSVLAAALASLLSGACQSTAPLRVVTPAIASEALNNDLARVAALAHSARRGAGDYRVGPGDLLEVDVFDANELRRTVRVRPDGSISLPLLGSLDVSGQTTSDLERTLGERLGTEYLWNPQVSVFVKEYRAHPVSVLGEVNEPGVFYLQEPRTLVEILSEAGGMTEKAGTLVHLRRRVRAPEPGQPEFETVSVDLHTHLSEDGSASDLLLADDDTIYVPKGGFVFVEGAVQKPGVYPLQGEGSVLKAITMAGGLAFQASRSKVQVIRRRQGSPEILRVDLGGIETRPQQDVAVRDGDVVVVGSSPAKVALNGIWRGLSGLVSVSANAF